MTDKALPFPHPPEAPALAVAPLPAGAQVAHLRIGRVLSESAHAIVYLAHDDSGGEPVALMEYFPRALALRQPDGSVRARQAGDAIALSVAREGFVQDANTLQAIRHPGVMPVLGSLQAHRTVYRAMPFIDGPTLERQVKERDRPATIGEVMRLLDGLLDALDALHKAGVVHGAVRPDQVLIARDGHPVLLGMGSAGAELAGHEPGPWSAPEQAAMSRHDRINSATDLYMAALTTWFAATGVAPPPLSDRLSRPHEWDPAVALAQLPEGDGDSGATLDNLALAISAALALVPGERPQRVADLRALLHASAAPSAFEPSGTTPLWVGAVPDRESQWEVLDGRATSPKAAPEVSSPRAAAPTGLHERAVTTPPIDDARQVSPTPRREPAAGAEPRAVTHRTWLWVSVALVGVAVAATAAWWALRRDTGPALPALSVPADPGPQAAPATASPPVAPPATMAAPAPVAAPVAAAPPTTPPAPASQSARPVTPRGPGAVPPSARAQSDRGSPRTACAGQTEFSRLFCMQQQCNTAAFRQHPHCEQLRRQGDIR